MVRDKAKLIKQLEEKPLPHDFLSIPVMNYQNGDINDFRKESCPKFYEEYRYFQNSSETYYVKKYGKLIAELMSVLKKPV